MPLAHSSLQNREAALLRATTELFVHGLQHDRDEIRRFEELVTHFLPKVSVSERVFVAEALATRTDAPTSVLRMLAKDLIEVAAPILSHSAALTPIDFLAVIAATGPLHHRLIARRRALPPEVIRALRLTHDDEVLAGLDATTDRAPPPPPLVPSRPLRRQPRLGPVPIQIREPEPVAEEAASDVPGA